MRMRFLEELVCRIDPPFKDFSSNQQRIGARPLDRMQAESGGRWCQAPLNWRHSTRACEKHVTKVSVMLRHGLVLFALIVVSLACSISRAERVGYSFTGAFQGSGTQTYSLFGITVPRNSPVSGTFSYDTTTPGVDAAPGVRTFHQFISGGYSLNINSGDIQLAASDYIITVANDYGSPASDLFSVDYNYDSANGVTPERIMVNGTEWAGARAFIKVALSWDPATFPEPDEPKLTADRPATLSPGVSAFVGSTGTPRLFSVTSISAIVPPVGDFNCDDKLDTNDYVEWRKVFGETESQFLCADANNDAIVDAADYVVWRKASAAGTGFAPVPEPSGLMMIVTGLVLVWRAMPWQRDGRQR